jgi:hypothetical protein
MMMPEPNIANFSKSLKMYSAPTRLRTGFADLHTLKKSLLDELKELKKIVVKKTAQVEKVIEQLEEASWYKVEDKEGQALILGFIKIAYKYYGEEKRYFASLKDLKSLGYWNQELDYFGNSLDDLEETLSDIESRFLTLDKVEGFKETMDKLSKL